MFLPFYCIFNNINDVYSLSQKYMHVYSEIIKNKSWYVLGKIKLELKCNFHQYISILDEAEDKACQMQMSFYLGLMKFLKY